MTAPVFVFYGALAFMLGVAAAGLGWNPIFVAALALAVGFLALFFLGRLRFWKRLLVFAVLTFIGVFYYHFRINLAEAERNFVFDKDIEFSAVVAGEPRVFEKHQIVAVRAEAPYKGDATLFLPPLFRVEYGDILKIKGRIQPPDSDAADPAMFFPKSEVVGKNRGNRLRQKLFAFKRLLLRQFDGVLGADEASLLGGITFGARSGFSGKLREQMAASGTTHIVALSGYNITILAIAVFYVSSRFFSRRKTFYISVFTIALFVLMVGGEPSVVRAAIMGLLALSAGEAGRLYDIKTAVALTAAAMAIYNPTVLTHDVGFQLSFLSLLGIVYLSPALKNVFKFRDEGFLGWKETATLTLSAQLMVMPVLISVFGKFSLTAVLANILILEFVPLTMALGFLLAATSAIYSYLGFFAAKLVGLLLGYEILIIKIFAGLRLPLDFLAQNQFIFAVVYYAAIVSFIYYFLPRTKPLVNRGVVAKESFDRV